MNIRLLLKQTNDLIEICYDCHVGMRNISGSEDFDIEQATDHLSRLRDVLEKLFKAATSGGRSLGSDLTHGLLSIVKEQISEMEKALNQESGRKRIKGISSSFDLDVILRGLASSTATLSGVVEANGRCVDVFSIL